MKNIKILLVDGDPVYTSEVSEQLKADGSTVDIVENRAEAEKALAAAKYDLVIIDSGTVPVIVSMCVTACDRLLIPMMMSQQCIGHTRNTINLARRKHTRVLGLLPMAAGRSRWDRAILENWEEIIRDTPDLGWDLGLMEGIPQSRTVVKADPVSGTIPSVALPALEKIYETLGL